MEWTRRTEARQLLSVHRARELLVMKKWSSLKQTGIPLPPSHMR